MSGREAECARLEIVYTGRLVSGVQIPPHPPIKDSVENGTFFVMSTGDLNRRSEDRKTTDAPVVFARKEAISWQAREQSDRGEP